MSNEYLLEEETYQILGACFEVYNDKLCDNHRSQVLNYLNATGIQVALLVYFGHHPKLEYERMVNQKKEARR